MMCGSLGKYARAVTIFTAAVNSKEGSWDIIDNHQEPLSCISHRHQHKINVQATDTATVMTELKSTLEENHM